MRRLVPLAAGAALLAAGFAPPAGAEEPTPEADRVAPVLSKVKLTPKVARRARGATLTFTLSEPAAVAGVVELRRGGVRTRGGRCLPRREGRRGSRCTRRTRAGTFAAPNGAQGANSARIAMRRLRPGAYTLRLTPTDGARNRGAERRVAFRVAR